MQNKSAQHGVKGFLDYREMIDSKIIDAVLIATPHYFHPDIALYAFQKGAHVLTEKPVAVQVKDAERMNQAAQKSGLVYGVMFQERTLPHYAKIKELVGSGELGDLTRFNWIVTTSFRSQAYYNSGSWRATWSGEGGGVLLNQAPHHLDILQWITGLPAIVHGHCYLGKTHKIAVEDEVTAFLEYTSGATGVFITSTGEAPGTNRMEICGDRGKLVLENDTLTFYRTRVSVQEFSRTTPALYDAPETWKAEIPITKKPAGHKVITQNFVNAILKGEPLIAPGMEGINSLSLGNAMLMSSLTGKSVSLPLDAAAYDQLLQDLIRKEKNSKK
jgi:predicted dehydrogenase